jgi:hypothetical protein
MKRNPFIRFRAMVWVQNHKSTSKFGGPQDMVDLLPAFHASLSMISGEEK